MGAVTEREATLNSGGLGEFDQVHGLAWTQQPAYEGSGAARAHYGGGGGNSYSRGIFNVDWRDGDEVWMGAAYYLPAGFKNAVQGQVDLMRWDNWASFGDVNDKSGVVISGTDKRARQVRMRQTVEQVYQGDAFDVPEGRWFWLEMHQKLSSQNGQALTEVYLDGRLVSRSTDANTYGRKIDRARFGIVAIAAGRQYSPLTLYVDRARVSRTQSGPIGAPPAGEAPSGGDAPAGAGPGTGGDNPSGADAGGKRRPTGRVVGPVAERLTERGAVYVRARASRAGTLRSSVTVGVPGMRAVTLRSTQREAEAGEVVRYWLKLDRRQRARVRRGLKREHRATVRLRLIERAGGRDASTKRAYRIER